MRDISSIENLERKTMEQTTAKVLKVQVSNLAIKNTTIPVTIEQKETGYGVYMVFPRELEFCCSMDRAEEQKTDAYQNCDANLKPLLDEKEDEYTRKRYKVQDIANGLRKIQYKAASVSYVRKALSAGFKIPKEGTTLRAFLDWVKDTGFKCPNR